MSTLNKHLLPHESLHSHAIGPEHVNNGCLSLTWMFWKSAPPPPRAGEAARLSPSTARYSASLWHPACSSTPGHN